LKEKSLASCKGNEAEPDTMCPSLHDAPTVINMVKDFIGKKFLARQKCVCTCDKNRAIALFFIYIIIMALSRR
jgi:hypothetical protein